MKNNFLSADFQRYNYFCVCENIFKMTKYYQNDKNIGFRFP